MMWTMLGLVVSVGALALLTVMGATRRQRRSSRGVRVYTVREGRFYPSELESTNARQQREEEPPR